METHVAVVTRDTRLGVLYAYSMVVVCTSWVAGGRDAIRRLCSKSICLHGI